MVAGQVPDDSSRHDLDALWRATQERLRARSRSRPSASGWSRSSRSAPTATLYLTAPEGIRAWAERRYSSLIAEALADSGTALRQVSFAAGAGPSGTAAPPRAPS